MRCHKCGKLCTDKFMEMKRLNEAGTEIMLSNRICYNCHGEFLMEMFIRELKSGRADLMLKKYGIELHTIK